MLGEGGRDVLGCVDGDSRLGTKIGLKDFEFCWLWLWKGTRITVMQF